MQGFCDSYRVPIEQVLPWGSAERLLVAKGSWEGAADDIEAVTYLAGSSLGGERSHSRGVRIVVYCLDA